MLYLENGSVRTAGLNMAMKDKISGKLLPSCVSLPHDSTSTKLVISVNN